MLSYYYIQIERTIMYIVKDDFGKILLVIIGVTGYTR